MTTTNNGNIVWQQQNSSKKRQQRKAAKKDGKEEQQAKVARELTVLLIVFLLYSGHLPFNVWHSAREAFDSTVAIGIASDAIHLAMALHSSLHIWPPLSYGDCLM